MTCNMESNDPVLAGVTSWGIGTCDGTYPSVYTRMSEFFSWIQSQCSNCV
jgi:secreted trypsin-like serine protease